MNVTWACLVTEEDDEIKAVRLTPLLPEANLKGRNSESTGWWGWLVLTCGFIVLLTCLLGVAR